MGRALFFAPADRSALRGRKSVIAAAVVATAATPVLSTIAGIDSKALATDYTFTSLGAGQHPSINNQGQIVFRGSATVMLYDTNGGGNAVSIPQLPQADPYDINDLGEIVGSTSDGKPFFYTQGSGATVIPGLSGGSGAAMSLNNVGQIVGRTSVFGSGAG